MGSLNRVVASLMIVLAAAALALFLRSRGDRHRLGGATDIAETLEPVRAEFNAAVGHPRLLMVLAPACPVCLAGAEIVRDAVLAEDDDLRVLAVWMEALPFDITRNPARRVESFADEPRIVHFYDMRQLSGRALRQVVDWQDESLPWDIYLVYPAGVVWNERLPPPAAWFHQREVGNSSHLRLGEDLGRALLRALDEVRVVP